MKIFGCYVIATALCLAAFNTYAEPGDDAAVAKAQKEYEEALKSKDIGLINAMKIQLSVQQAKAKERNKKHHQEAQVNTQHSSI